MHFETDGEWVMTVAKPSDKHSGEKGTSTPVTTYIYTFLHMYIKYLLF